MKGRVDADRSHARDVVAGMITSESVAAQLAPLDRDAELEALRSLDDPAAIASSIPDDLVDEVTAAGSPEQVVASLRAVADTGVDAVAFVPVGPDPDEQLDLFATAVVPALRG